MYEYYSPENEKKYGVVGIKIKFIQNRLMRKEENDEEIKLLTKQIEYINDFDMSNIIKAIIISE